MRRVGAIIAAALLTGACGGDDESSSQPLEGEVIGGVPDEFGLDAGGGADTSLTDDGLEVRWNTTEHGPRVVGLAELWSGDERDAFVEQGGAIEPVADDLVDRFGPEDAEPVADSVMGGAHYFYYESEQLGDALGADDELADGRFFVVVNLNPHVSDRVEPLSSAEEPPGADAGAERLFTVAIVAGSPWP